MSQNPDIIVIGAGIAGASVAAELAAHARVLLLEMERYPGFHATGRSAAFFSPSYGNATVRAITAVSEVFYRNPPEGFNDVPLIRRRETLFVGRADQLDAIGAMQAGNNALLPIDGAAVRQAVPILRSGYAAAGLRDTAGGDLETDLVLQGYLRLLRQRGGDLVTDQRVGSIAYDDGCWHLATERGNFATAVIVNAAGAWADEVAVMAGLGRLGIIPKRRTALLIDPPAGLPIENWPLVVDVDESFYFKPDAGRILISPADETPSPPCDAQPDEYDIAVALDRFEMATGLAVKRINHRWAGLRSFAPDKTFVCGFDSRCEGFFWLAGQGGYGVQAAPGLAQLACQQITGFATPGPAAGWLDLAAAVAPARLIAN